ncbi:hypothetical protein [Galbibacter sp.]|uniref:hypothetical protein n=1 Tax=Galbibacter sp. TaxID=2918471 RepID=UPI003A937AE5
MKYRYIHILVNRIDEQGKTMLDYCIGFEAQRAAHEVALKHGWTSIRQENEEINKSQKFEWITSKSVLTIGFGSN